MSAIASPVEENSGTGSYMTPLISTATADEPQDATADEPQDATAGLTPYVNPAQIRPFPQINPSAPRRKASRIGRTRILTDTPEKQQIEEEQKKKQEKEKKQKERPGKGVKRVLHPPEMVKTGRKKTKFADKENCAPNPPVFHMPTTKWIQLRMVIKYNYHLIYQISHRVVLGQAAFFVRRR